MGGMEGDASFDPLTEERGEERGPKRSGDGYEGKEGIES